MVPRETINFVSRESQCADGNIEIRGEKIDCFPRGQSLSHFCYIAGNFKAENSWNLSVTAVVGQHSRVNSALLPSDVIDFARFPAQRFWRKTVSLLDITWPWRTFAAIYQIWLFNIHKRIGRIHLVFAKKYLLSANCNQPLFADIRKMLGCVKIFLAKN